MTWKLDLPASSKGCWTVISGAYTTSLRVLSAPFGRCWYVSLIQCDGLQSDDPSSQSRPSSEAGKQIWKASCPMIFHAFFSCLLILELYASPSNIASIGMATGDCTWGDIWDFQLLKSWKKDSSQIFEVTCCCFTWQPCWSWCQPQRRWNILQLGKWGENLETKGRHLENLRDRFRGLEGKIAGNPT